MQTPILSATFVSRAALIARMTQHPSMGTKQPKWDGSLTV
jgi:hypothetical protein